MRTTWHDKRQGSGKGCKGFTLLEVLIATALLALFLTILYRVFFTTLKAEDRVTKDLDLYLDIRRTFDAISMEVQSAFFSEKHLKTFFVGERRDSLGRTTSSLSFTTLTYPILQEGIPGSDMVAVSYSVEEKDGGLTLLKGVWNPYLESGDKESQLRIPLVEGIEGFEVEFYNGREWAKAWDATLERRLPFAVRVTLTFKEGGEERGVSTIALPRIGS